MTVDRVPLVFLVLAAVLFVIGAWMLAPVVAVFTAGFLCVVVGALTLEVKPDARVGAPRKPQR